MPVAAAGGYVATFGNKVIYAGGATWQNGVKRMMTETQVYDLDSGRWTAGPELPEPLAYGASAQTRRGLEIYGGAGAENSSRKCWLLESAAGPWKPCPDMTADTVLAKVHAVGNDVLIFGGCPNVTDLAKCSASVRRRKRDGAWTEVAEMPQGPLAVMASAALNGSVYLFGGASIPASGILQNRSDAYRFDAASQRWTKLRALPRAGRGMSAVAVDSRYILVGGGYVASPAEAAGKPTDFGFSADAFLYDTKEDVYHPVDPMPLASTGLALVSVRRGVLAIGGEHRMRERSPKVFWAEVRAQSAK